MSSGLILHHQILGQGPALLILHGLFGSLRNWQTLAKRYAENYTVISIDARNHGRSFHDDKMSYVEMANDVERLAAHLGLDQYHLLGHSMGGKTAIKIAQNCPDNVTSLIVADIAPIVYDHSHDHLIEPVLALDLNSISRRQEVDSLLKKDITDPLLRSFLLHNLTQDDGIWLWNVNWSAIKKNMGYLLGLPVNEDDWQVTTPTLVIYGGSSEYLSDAGKAQFDQHFTRLEYLEIEGAGHWLHAEKPDVFFKTTSNFLHSG